MADVKISQLPSATSVSTSTTLAVVQSGTTYQATLSQVSDAIGSGVSSIIAGSGVSVDQSTGDVTISATGGGASTGDYTFTGNVITLPLDTSGSFNVSATETPLVGGPFTQASSDFTSAQGTSGSNGIFFGGINGDFYTFATTTLAVGQTFTCTQSGQTYTLTIEYLTSMPSGPGGEMVLQVSPLTPGGDFDNFNFYSAPVVVNYAYDLASTGEFTTTALVAGNIYIAENIVTPLPLVIVDAYGNETDIPQPLVVNGDTQLLGNLSVTNANILGNLYFTNANTTIQIGSGAGNVESALNSIAIGTLAGSNAQGQKGIAIGQAAGSGNQGSSAVAIGEVAGTLNQGGQAVAIGSGAAQTAQGTYALAIGAAAGADTQGTTAVAIGYGAGFGSQGAGGVAIGQRAGYDFQGANSIAIGTLAGQTNQASSTIILNATGSVLDQSTSNTFTVKPVRQGGTSGSIPNGFFQMAYNPTTGEIIYWS